MEDSSDSLARALRLLESARFQWSRGSPAAKETAVQCMVVLNTLLKSQEDGDGDGDTAFIKNVCHDAMQFYEFVKQQKRPPFDMSLEWLSSHVDGRFYPPVMYNVQYVENTPLSDELLIPNELTLVHYNAQSVDYWGYDGFDGIFQDLLQNCSFVTALLSLSRLNSSLLVSSITPHREALRYAVILHFNGCRRLVEVSPSLPEVSQGSLYVRSTTNEKLIWPALLEKAFLRVHGHGYDFKGSNACLDTYMLSGWIPEFVSSQSRPDLYSLWERLYDPFQKNKLVLALGTGNHTHGEYSTDHDYAITSMDNSTRCVVVKNPWLKHTTIVQFDDLFQHFDTLYLNWNPEHLKHKTVSAIHSGEAKLLFKMPQYKLQNDDDEPQEFKILLEKHLTNGHVDTAINLGVFQSHGERLFNKTIPLTQNFANNTPFHLTTVTLQPRECVTLVIFHDSPTSQTFTLHAYTDKDFTLHKSPNLFAHMQQLEEQWDVETCGGHWGNQSYLQNPQYEVIVRQETSMIVQLSTPRDTLVNLQLFFDGLITSKSVSVVHEKYSPGVMTSKVELKRGKYVLIPSTYHTDIHATYTLIINSSQPVEISRKLTRLGIFTKPFSFKWGGKNRYKLSFTPSRQTTVSLHLWTPGNGYRPKIRASLFYSTGELIRINEHFDDDLFGIWINDIRVESRECVLLIERFEVGDDVLEGVIGSDYAVELA